jgi:hypothetical protein
MPASNSTGKDIKRSSHRGASSERKIATPRLSGRAITSANTDETSVPKMKGNAPYSSFTGSQVVVVKKFQPNFSIESFDPRYDSYPIRTTSAKIATAKIKVRFLKSTSPRLRLREDLIAGVRKAEGLSSPKRTLPLS